MLLNVIRVIARRWYVVLLGLLLTAGLAFGAMLTTPAEFKSRALLLLLPSEEAVGEGGNPFLALSGLEQPASLVTAYFTSTAAQEAVAERSGTASYVVELDAQVRGPVILVEVTDQTAVQSLATLDYLTQRVQEELRRLQDEVGAPESSIIGSMLLTRDAEAAEDDSAMIRLVIAAVAAGLAGTLFLAFGVDGFMARRSTRRAQDGPLTEAGSRPADADAAVPVEGAGQGPGQVAVPRERSPSHGPEGARSHQRAGSR